MAVDLLYVAELDDSGVLQALQRIENKVDGIADKMNVAFTNVGKNAKNSFNTLSKEARDAFGKIDQDIKGLSQTSTDLNKQLKDLTSSLQQLAKTKKVEIKADIKTPAEQVQAPQATGAAPSALTNEIAQAAERNYIRILAAELRAVAGADQLTQSLINQAAATAKTTTEFEDAVRQTGTLTNTEISYAKSIAATKQALGELVAGLDKSSATYDEQLELISDLQSKLRAIEEIQRQAGERQAATAEAAAAAERQRIEAIQQVREEAERQLRVQAQIEKANLALQERTAREAEKRRKEEEAAIRARIAARQKELEAARRVFVANARGNQELAQAIGALVREEGQLNLVLTENTTGLNRNERELLDVINRSRELTAVTRNLRNQLGEGTVLQLNQGDFPIRQIQETAKGFGNIGLRAGFAGGAVIAVTNLIKDFVREGLRGLRQVADTTIQTTEQFVLLRKSLQAVLDTSERGAEAAFREVRRLSEQYGADVAGLAAAFLPLIDTFDQLEDITVLTKGLQFLARISGKPASDAEAIRAIAEGLSGDFRSIRQIFELTFEETDKLKDAFRGTGIAGFLKELRGVLTARGIDFEAIFNTLETKVSIVREIVRSLLDELGKPVRTELIKFFDNFINLLNDNRGTINDILFVLGDFISQVINFSGGRFIEFFDKIDSDGPKVIEFFRELESLFIVIQGLQDSFDALELLESPTEGLSEKLGLPKTLTLLGDIYKTMLGLKPPDAKLFDSLIDAATEFLGLVEQGFNVDTSNLINGINMVGSAIEGDGASLSVRVLRFQKFILVLLEQVGRFVTFLISAPLLLIDEVSRRLEELTGRDFGFEEGVTATVVENIYNAVQETLNLDAATQALTESLEAQTEALRENNARLDEQINKQEDLGDIPEIPDRERKLTETEEAILKRRLELERDFVDRTLELELELAQERIDILEDYGRKLEEIERKHQDDIADAIQDNADKRADIEQDYADDLIDQEKERNDKRLEIEREYQRKIAELRRKFQFDAQEAIRANDAIAFLQLRRRLAFDEREARIRRDEKLEDLEQEGQQEDEERARQRERRLRDLQVELERELRDIEIANERKLREARIAHEQELADLVVAEERKREELQRSYEQQLDEFALFVAEKEGTLAEWLAAEFKLINEGNQKIVDKEDEFYQQRLENFRLFRRNFLEEVGQGLDPGLVGVIGQGTGYAESQQYQIQQLKNQTRRLAMQQGVLTPELQLRIDRAVTLEEVRAILNEIVGAPGGVTGGGRRFGGPVQANTPYLVGEAGPELFVPNFSGKIIPLADPNNFSLNLPSRAGVSNTRNFNYQNNFSMLDMSTLSPTQVAIIQQIITQVMLQVSTSV